MSELDNIKKESMRESEKDDKSINIKTMKKVRETRSSKRGGG